MDQKSRVAGAETQPLLHVVDGGQRRPAEETLQERERWFTNLLDALPAALYTTDAAGRVTYYNQAAAEIWGRKPVLGETEWCGSWKLYWADGTPLPLDQCPMAVALREDRPIRGMEAIVERPDGTRVPLIPFPTPLHDASGKLVGGVNMLLEISDRKRAEERQSLLVRELHHRVKNTLATVQAIMGSTARHSSTIEEFQQAFVGRIASLSKTHNLLTETTRQTVSFKDLLTTELSAFDDGSKRIKLSGPDIEMSSEIAVPVAMAVHELTTNAVRHGALAELGGSVEVVWSARIEADGSTLEIVWTERGGPPVRTPDREGFGSRLLRHVLSSQIGAQTVLDYDREGLRAQITVPLPQQTLSLL